MARILVVDDLADNVKLLAYELEDQGHEVLTAQSGRQALGIASAKHPDLILLDVMMPEMDGIEVCRRLKEDARTRTIPIILVTAKGLDENVIAGLDAGADDYVPKPFHSGVLAARIRCAVRIRECYDTVARTNELLREEIAVRKQTEEDLRKSEMKFRTMYDSSGDAVLLLNREGLLDCNDSALRMFGYRSRPELCSMHPADLSPAIQAGDADSMSLADQRIADSLQHGKSRFEWIHRRSDGSEFPAEVLLSPMELEGKPALQAVVRDITERRRAEDNATSFGRIFECLLNEIYMFDADTLRFIQVNRGARENLGYSIEELRELTPLDIKPEHTHESFGELVAPLRIGAQEAVRFSTIHQRKDGSSYPVEVHLQLTRYESCPAFVAIVLDVTEQKRTEASLRKLSLAVEQSPATVVITDTQGAIEYVNPKFTETTGYERHEAIGQNPRVLKSGEMPPEAYKELWDTITAGNVWRGEFHNKRKDGDLYWEAASICPIVDSQGNVTHFLAVKEDITDKKRTEESLQISEVRYRTLFDSSRDAIMTLNAEEGFLSGNAATVELFGCEVEEEFTSQGPADLSPERQPDGQLSMVKAQEMMAIAMEEGSHFFEWTHCRLDGAEFPATVLLTRIELEGRMSLQATVRDITQQKETEAALRDKEKQLQHRDKMSAVGGLAGGIAHEFNNLLQAIRGYTTFAMDELSPDEQPHQDLQQALVAADRAASLTSQLLSFSRRDPLHLDSVDPNKVAGDLVHMLRPLIGESIEFDMLLDGEVGTVHADANLLGQALLNLCINARDAMPSGGKITIRTDNLLVTEMRADISPDFQPGRYVRFMVTDNGCGMSAKIRDKIFEPFFTTKEVGDGTGLGLAMVYGVVKQHHGAISVYSEPGNGTTFRLYLPVAEQAEIAGIAEDVQPDCRGHETILIAEDEPLVRDVAVRILERAGYSTQTAADGEEAVRLFREHIDDIAMILSDVMMPRLNGHEALQQIRQLRPDIPAVFCTGYDSAAPQASFLSEEGLAVVEKPFDATSLLSAVRDALDRSSSSESAELTVVGQELKCTF